MRETKGKSKSARPKSKGSAANNSQERQRKIAVAAYYKAERRGFAPGQEERDWLEAEKEIDA